MAASVTVQEAQAGLKELIDRLTPGEEITITEGQHPVAKLIAEKRVETQATRPGPGLCRGMITYIAPDFDAPLEDMKEYTE